MKKKDYQVCTKCVMDTTDPQITFNNFGVCNHCENFDKNIKPYWDPKENRFDELMILAKKIKKSKGKSDYDCILGLSGGADSSYLAYVAKEIMGLNPLIYVVDTGWNLNVAVENIEKIVRGLNLDMYTDVINWKEMTDFQLAMFKSNISSQDAPQDHAIFASIYNYAVKNNIKYILTGSNRSTEFIRPPVDWIYLNDLRMYKDIHKKFGKIKLKTFPTCGIIKYKVFYRIFKGMKRVYPLDYIVYDKEKAEQLLIEKFGYTKYQNKHYENVFTRFFEGYYLPNKFEFDTRKNVYSNQILAGTLTREDVINKLSKPSYEEDLMIQDKEYIAKKLGISVLEFDEIINMPNKTPHDYKNSLWLMKIGTIVLKLLRIESRNIKMPKRKLYDSNN
jgi:N-acetyl sugar amidotransferase